MKTLAVTLVAVLLATSAGAAPTLTPATGPGHAKATEVKRTRAKRVRKPRSAKASPFDASDCSNVPTRCGDARNCADAKRALACGVTRLDRDHDGIPCESICG